MLLGETEWMSLHMNDSQVATDAMLVILPLIVSVFEIPQDHALCVHIYRKTV